MEYSAHVHMITEECCNCGVVFGMSKDYYERRRFDGKSFHCPRGHSQHYTVTTEQKLRRELEKKEREIQRQQHRAVRAESLAQQKSKQYRRIRDRIKNGVCPCCNRTFENVARHIATKHPDFGKEQNLKVLRELYGLTQADLANELGISGASVSQYEKGNVGDGGYVKATIERWVEQQTSG